MALFAVAAVSVGGAVPGYGQSPSPIEPRLQDSEHACGATPQSMADRLKCFIHTIKDFDAAGERSSKINLVVFLAAIKKHFELSPKAAVNNNDSVDKIELSYVGSGHYTSPPKGVLRRTCFGFAVDIDYRVVPSAQVDGPETSRSFVDGVALLTGARVRAHLVCELGCASYRDVIVPLTKSHGELALRTNDWSLSEVIISLQDSRNPTKECGK